MTDKPFAKKSLGQHFLTDPSYRDRIVRLAEIGGDDFVVEIGPGTGLLTAQLLERARAVTAIEIDPDMVARLAGLSDRSATRLNVVQADVLRVDWKPLLPAHPCKVVGNLPYNIATAIIHQMMEIKHRFHSLVLMLQKEVAQRILAQPGDTDYGYFTVLCRHHFEAEAGFDVPPGAFRPPPRVNSHVLRLRPTSAPSERRRWAPLERLLRRAFAQRRKTLLNNLRCRRHSAEQVRGWLRECSIPERARAQEVDLERFLCLARMLQSAQVDE